MALHFHSLTVKEVKKETADCVSVAFDVPDELKNIFQFVQGQNITIKKMLGNKEVRRTYSICSSPLDNELRIAIKKADLGIFSTYANTLLHKGDKLEVLPPAGKFYTRTDKANHKNYLAFVAGSGITPVISIIKTTLTIEPESSFTLVYGNQTRSSIIFFEELEALKNKYINRFSILYVFSREKSNSAISNGRIDKEKLPQLNKIFQYKKMDEIFICGPQAMLFCIRDFLEELGIDKKKIHFELFASDNKIVEADRKITSAKTDSLSNITIISDGRQHNFELNDTHQSILDAALQQGIDLPFACKGGMCCSCKALLKEGKVAMDVHWGLEQEDIDQNYILTCQAHPLTRTIVIDFDSK